MAPTRTNPLHQMAEMRVQAACLIVAVMLAVDPLNPVKVVCNLLELPTHGVAVAAFVLLVYLIGNHIEDVFYFSVKIFFHSILSIFFASVEVVGVDNVPANGPVIFTGNHMNQFVDAVVMMCCVPHKVGFLIAEKSWYRPVVGHLARLAGAVPVARPQDSATKGVGMVELHGRNVTGFGTEFTKSFAPGDKLNIKTCMEPFRVAKVVSDTELILADEPDESAPKERSAYEIHKYKDQTAVFRKVHEHLARGESIGIFPEGGSHDRTDLLPLKAGVAVIAFGALEHYNVSVPIVPVGLNYFRGHRFRGRVVVEFGAPIRLSEGLYNTYRTNKKDACTQLLTEVEDGMRSVIVTAPNYDVLSMLYVARRLYMRTERKLNARDRQDMNRRFAEGYKLLMNKYEGREPKEFADMKKKILDYSELLKTWGLRDYQVPTLTVQSPSALFYQFMHMLLVFVLASIPTLLLNAPVGLLARMVSETERKKALKSSNVKVAARDVMLSKKILISLVAIPTLWISYVLLLFTFTNLSARFIVLVLLSFPVFSYYGVMAAEAGMVDLKDMRPAFLRLLPAFRRQAQLLPKIRASLQREVRAFVKHYGPECGSLYYDKVVKWDEYIRRTQSVGDLASFGEQAADSIDHEDATKELDEADETGSDDAVMVENSSKEE